MINFFIKFQINSYPQFFMDVFLLVSFIREVDEFHTVSGEVHASN